MTAPKRNTVFFAAAFISIFLLNNFPCISSETVKALPSAPQFKGAPAPNSHDKPHAPSLPTFKGVGNKDGKLETGFKREEKSDYKQIFEGKEQNSGVKLPENVQIIVDKAGNLLKNIDDGTLKAVSGPLSVLGLEAEKARLRPMNGGIGLGISINLEKKKKKTETVPSSADKKPSGSQEKNNEQVYEVYELFAPERSEEEKRRMLN